MKKLLIWGALLTALWFPKSAFAQGYTVNDIVLSNFGTSIGNVGKPIAGAVITVCSIGATGMPCTPTANAYTDYTLGTLIDQSTNPITSDAAGNYTFSVAVGANYVVTITGNKVKPRSYIVTAIVGASNCGTLANTEVLYGTGLATCSVSPNFTWTNSTNTFGLTQGTATWPALLITPNASASQPIFYAGSPSSQFSTAANTDLFFFSQAGGSTAPFGTPSTAALGAEFAWSVDNLASGNTGGLMSASECTTTCSTHTPVGMWAFANGNNATGTSSPFGMQIQASTSGAGAG